MGVALVLTGCANDVAEAAEPAEEVSLLFALDATSATVTATGDGYDLRLREPSDVLVFTDRPVRQARRGTVEEFAAAWDEMFRDVPPNGALSGLTVDGAAVDIPVELTTISQHGDELEFSISVLPGVEVGPLPGDLTDVSLFIDNAAPPCSSGATSSACRASTFIPFDSSF